MMMKIPNTMPAFWPSEIGRYENVGVRRRIAAETLDAQPGSRVENRIRTGSSGVPPALRNALLPALLR